MFDHVRRRAERFRAAAEEEDEEEEELRRVREEVERAKRRAAAAASSPAEEADEPRRASKTTGREEQASAAKITAGEAEASLSSEELERLKESLRGTVPEAVIDRELPWILKDVEAGKRLIASRS
eukprot:TRINITY_DN1767_c0_g4_i1.p2 TRINITY_DN1767_c0_g4~~TRINITY_DN1767_c0_g4_i1.p2  ORF type:complete len:125 (+),score=37.99 TRINITY_DN1767_c0_g4_i1:128-502(+)